MWMVCTNQDIQYPLVIWQFAIENGPVENSWYSYEKMVIFHSFLYVYQRLLAIIPMKLERFGGSSNGRRGRGLVNTHF